MSSSDTPRNSDNIPPPPPTHTQTNFSEAEKVEAKTEQPVAIERSRSNPIRPNNWIVALGILIGLGILLAFRLFSPSPEPRVFPSVTATLPNDKPISPIEAELIRMKAWDKVLPRIEAADQRGLNEIDRSLEQLNLFFSERKKGAKELSIEILSMKGKWAYLKSKLPYASEDVHFTYLNNNFNKYVFTPDELKKSIESAIASYILELRGVENQLLVNIRADIFDSDLYESGALPEFNSDRIFQEDYNKMLETVTKHVSGDLSVDVSRELFSLIAGEIAAKVALRVGTAVSTRLGLTAGIATTGVAFSWATLGVSIAAVIVIDIAVDWLLKLAGYEPEKQVEDKVKDTLSKIQLLLIEGDSQAIAAYEKLRRLESEDPDENVRKACKSAADSIERSGNLGLRRELINVHKWRSDVRKGALKKLIQEGGKSK